MNNNENSTIESYYNEWIKGITDPNLYDINENNKEYMKPEDEGFDLLHVICKPRFKWFNPPFSIRIPIIGINISFMWAFKIDKVTKLENCKIK